MIGPPHFPDNPIPTWEEFLSDYIPHFFDDINPDQGRSYIIEVEGEAVGHINYNEIDRSTDTVELDIWMAERKYCNKGYGTDAINTLCQYLADHLNCQTYVLAPSARNKAAIKAYEKCGFKPAHKPLQHFIHDYSDTIVMIRKA
jgi:diamine N-acetyltransferase